MAQSDAWKMLVPLMRGTLENMADQGPEKALTGPLVRGDVSTVQKHLQSLSPDEAELYRVLGQAVLRLTGLDSETSHRLENELRDA